MICAYRHALINISCRKHIYIMIIRYFWRKKTSHNTHIFLNTKLYYSKFSGSSTLPHLYISHPRFVHPRTIPNPEYFPPRTFPTPDNSPSRRKKPPYENMRRKEIPGFCRFFLCFSCKYCNTPPRHTRHDRWSKQEKYKFFW